MLKDLELQILGAINQAEATGKTFDSLKQEVQRIFRRAQMTNRARASNGLNPPYRPPLTIAGEAKPDAYKG